MTTVTPPIGFEAAREAHRLRRSRREGRPLTRPEDRALVAERVENRLPALLAGVATLPVPEDRRAALLRAALPTVSTGTCAELVARLLPLGADYVLLASFGDDGQEDAADALLRLAMDAARVEIAARVRLYGGAR